MDETLRAQALVLKLSQAELIAIRSLLRGESLSSLASILSTDWAGALQTTISMKNKLGAVQDAEAVRVALYAGLGNLDA